MISRKAYYGGRPSSSSSIGNKRKSSKKRSKKSSKPVSSAVLSGIIDRLCVGELNQSGDYQAIKVAVMAKNDDSNLGRLSRMSYAMLDSEYGMKSIKHDSTTEVDATQFRIECGKAAAKAKQ